MISIFPHKIKSIRPTVSEEFGDRQTNKQTDIQRSYHDYNIDIFFHCTRMQQIEVSIRFSWVKPPCKSLPAINQMTRIRLMRASCGYGSKPTCFSSSSASIGPVQARYWHITALLWGHTYVIFLALSFLDFKYRSLS